MLDLQERLELLEEARNAILEAAEWIEQAVDETELEAFAASYIIPALKMAASAEHEYLGQPARQHRRVDRGHHGRHDARD
jgi:hypothetical protein